MCPATATEKQLREVKTFNHNTPKRFENGLPAQNEKSQTEASAETQATQASVRGPQWRGRGGRRWGRARAFCRRRALEAPIGMVWFETH